MNAVRQSSEKTLIVPGFAFAGGGTFGGHEIYAGKGSLSIPLGGAFGMQIDGIGGSWDHRTFAAVAGHFFWRIAAAPVPRILATERRRFHSGFPCASGCSIVFDLAVGD